MKKLSLILILLITQTIVLSQPCLPEGIEFTTQAQIDSFQINYPNCTEIEGYVIIHGNDITNLNGLNALTSIGGDLWIGDYNQGNPSLTSLAGLVGLNSIGGELWIYHNDVLASIISLEGMTSIGETLMISQNNALTSLMGLEGVTSIGGDLWISDNDALTSLTGLDNVTSIGADLGIYDNDSLIDLTGLDQLTFVGGDLRIGGHITLTNLSALEGLTSIGGDLYITDNNVLNSLNGLDNIGASTIGDLTIVKNDSLAICEIESICNYLASPNGIVTIFDNAIGCSNPPEVANACGITLPCLPDGNYYFLTQYDIDNFQVNYPGCTELEGLLFINGSDITNLNGLISVVSIGDMLTINTNPVLTSLTGLDSLTTIGGELRIVSNNTLACLTGLDNLISVGWQLGISGNKTLTNLTGLNNLTSIGGSLKIIYNDTLLSLAGLENLDASSINNLYIYDNPYLAECEIQSICDYLASPNAVIIHDNTTGCNSQEEVEAACTVPVVDLFINNDYSVSPNPFNSTTTLSYTLDKPSTVIIKIFNSQGQQVDEIVQDQQKGKQQVQWNAEGLHAGIYYYRIHTGTQVGSGTMILLR